MAADWTTWWVVCRRADTTWSTLACIPPSPCCSWWRADRWWRAHQASTSNLFLLASPSLSTRCTSKRYDYTVSQKTTLTRRVITLTHVAWFYNFWLNVSGRMCRAVKRWLVCAPHLTNVSALPGETWTPEKKSQRTVNISCKSALLKKLSSDWLKHQHSIWKVRFLCFVFCQVVQKH